MKKQGRQLNILNSLFLKNSKEQKSSSREIPDSQIELKASKELGVAIRQKEVSNMVGRSNYSSELRTHKQLLEKYLQHSEKYFNDLAEYKKGYLVLNRSLEDFNQLSQKMADKKEEYTSEMVKYEGIKQKYEQSLKEYQEITEEYENIIQDREVVQRKFEEHSIALKKINDEVQELIDKKSEKNDIFVELKGKLVIEREVFKATQSRLNGIVSVYDLLKKIIRKRKKLLKNHVRNITMQIP